MFVSFWVGWGGGGGDKTLNERSNRRRAPRRWGDPVLCVCCSHPCDDIPPLQFDRYIVRRGTKYRRVKWPFCWKTTAGLAEEGLPTSQLPLLIGAVRWMCSRSRERKASRRGSDGGHWRRKMGRGGLEGAFHGRNGGRRGRHAFAMVDHGHDVDFRVKRRFAFAQGTALATH